MPVNTGEQTLQISGITPINAVPCTHVEGTVETGVILCSGYSSISVNKRILTKERVTYYSGDFSPFNEFILVSCVNFFPPWCNSSQWARVFSLSRLQDHIQTHHTRYDSPGRVNSP